MNKDTTPTTHTDEDLRRKVKCALGYCEAVQHEDCLYESSRNESQELDLIMQIIKRHREQYAAERVMKARLEQMDSHIGRLGVLRAWTVNHQPVFETGERMATFTLHEIDDEIKIVKNWKAQLSPKDPTVLECTCCRKHTTPDEAKYRIFNSDNCACGGDLLKPGDITDDCACGLRVLVTKAHVSQHPNPEDEENKE